VLGKSVHSGAASPGPEEGEGSRAGVCRRSNSANVANVALHPFMAKRATDHERSATPQATGGGHDRRHQLALRILKGSHALQYRAPAQPVAMIAIAHMPGMSKAVLLVGLARAIIRQAGGQNCRTGGVRAREGVGAHADSPDPRPALKQLTGKLTEYHCCEGK